MTKQLKQTQAAESIDLKNLSLDDLVSDPNSKQGVDMEHEPFMMEVAIKSKNYETLKEYINSEISRLVSLGKSPLKAIYQNAEYVDYVGSRQVIEALENAGVSHVWLKLTPDAAAGECPGRDPYGALINPSLRGKVLVAKIGNAGGNLSESQAANGNATAKFSGSGRKLLMASRKGYELEIVTGEPKRYSLKKAMLILAQWGYGVRAKRFIKLDVNLSQDSWLVTECKIEETYESFLENKDLNAALQGTI